MVCAPYQTPYTQHGIFHSPIEMSLIIGSQKQPKEKKTNQGLLISNFGVNKTPGNKQETRTGARAPPIVLFVAYHLFPVGPTSVLSVSQ